MKNQILMDELIMEAGEIAVVSTSLPAEAVVIAKRLYEKGVRAMELAYRDTENFDGTDECIRAVRDEVPEMLVGAATVTCPALAKRAKKSGAQFVLSAGFNPKTVKWCVKHNMPVYPGTATPGEIEQAMGFGLWIVKVFPVEVLGGTKYLKALTGPYPDCKYIVSGGVNAENAASYKEMECVAAVSGTYLTK